MRDAFQAALLLVFSAFGMFAADISGNWTLKVQVANRDTSLQLTLKQNGQYISGTVTGPRRSYPIESGSLDSANNIKLVLGGEGPLAGATIGGSVEDDHLRVTLQTQKGQVSGTAARTQ